MIETYIFDRVTVVHKSAAALLCKDESSGRQEWWPYSQIIESRSEIGRNSPRGASGELEVTLWIAEQKGF